MGWLNWKRQTTADDAVSGCRGLDLTSSRARAAMDGTERNRLLPLDGPNADLPLAIGLESRRPEIGRFPLGLIRKLPHAVCSGYLASIGQAREWKHGRHRLDALSALGLLFGKLRPLFSTSDSVFLGLPAYITGDKAAKISTLAHQNKFPLRGTVASALALVADRANALMTQQPIEPGSRAEGVVPMYRPGQGPIPTDVIVVDADDHALSGVLVRLDPSRASLVTSVVLPQASTKKWKDELIDSISDRCVRVCRRDPRDSAEAEQSLDDQIEEHLDGLREGKTITLNVRTENWYQDLRLVREDFIAGTTHALKASVSGIRELLGAGQAVTPPRAVLLTHEAGRLPGLARALYRYMTEATSVGVLRPEAVAAAVVRLGERWPSTSGMHLDHSIPLPVRPPETKTQSSLAKAKVK